MKKNDFVSRVRCLTGNHESLDSLLNDVSSHVVFEKNIKEFIYSFSSSVMKNTQAKAHPDLIALAYWMRKSNIEKLESGFFSAGLFKAPVGLVVHFAPANVDTIFIYSLFLSLLVGNKNIVRVSEKSSPQKDILIAILNQEINKPQFFDIRDRLSVITYPHSDEITQALCTFADMRVIWGGDSTVEKISSFSIKPTAKELKFSNKYSLCLLDANKLEELNTEDFQTLVKSFVNDTYWFGQQGCSSPRSIIWMNSSNNQGLVCNFWSAVESKARSMFGSTVLDADVMNKIVTSHLVATEVSDSKFQQNSKILTRVHLPDLITHNSIRELHCGSGLFYETEINDLAELAFIVDRKTQTISYFGFDSALLRNEFAKAQIYPDRVVPVGQALEFDVFWDGNNLLDSLTRYVGFR
ncbi:acyl-CoA reductase [Pseudoalteromonas peptidolytica]|uniref:acyl-CoA reductase n=1 Tax=Pseudoalteromonas peptidolytica TaxID=61150 RepID=UPI00298E24FD|nr:acyl-CoA reductase [Pseudoalteromonas peptidolytica]MDW7549443.1 acyl-CoA reductase [Pseudoalteromonas peptidolytica]